MNLFAAFLLTSPVLSEVAAQEMPASTLLSPLVSTGIVGIILVMVLLRFKIMPTWVHDEALAQKDREMAKAEAAHQREREAWEKRETEHIREKDALKKAVEDAQIVYTTQVIPTLTRVYDELSRKNGATR